MSYFQQESQRLRFRKARLEDISSWVEFFEDNDHLIFLGIDLTKDKKTLAREWIMTQLKRYQHLGLGHLAVELKADRSLIGMGGILPRWINERAEYEIVYSLKPAYWGQGYGTEMAQMLKAYGFQHLCPDRLISIIDVRNKASIRVAEKNGMDILFHTKYLGMNVNVYGIESPQKGD